MESHCDLTCKRYGGNTLPDRHTRNGRHGRFRDGSGCTSISSAQTNLTALTASWSSGSSWPSCPPVCVWLGHFVGRLTDDFHSFGDRKLMAIKKPRLVRSASAASKLII
jgi:hypothetical protein